MSHNIIVGVVDPPGATPMVCMLLRNGSVLAMAECAPNNKPRIVSPILRLADVQFDSGMHRRTTAMRALSLVAMGRYVVMAMDAGVLAVIFWSQDWQTCSSAHVVAAGYATPETASTLPPAMCVVNNATGGPTVLCCGGGAPAMFERMTVVKYGQLSAAADARPPFTALVPLVSPTPEKPVQPFKCCRMAAARDWVALVVDANPAAAGHRQDGTDGLFSYKQSAVVGYLPTTMVMACHQFDKVWSNWCPPKGVAASAIHVAWRSNDDDAAILIVVCGADIILLSPPTTAASGNNSSNKMRKMTVMHTMAAAVDLPVFVFHQGRDTNTLVTCNGCIVSKWASKHDVFVVDDASSSEDDDDGQSPQRDRRRKMPVRESWQVDVDPASQCMLMNLASAESACVCPSAVDAQDGGCDFVAAMMDGTGVLEICGIRTAAAEATAPTHTATFRVDRIPECDAAQCTICLGPVDEVAQISVLSPCTHMFHKDCIDAWKARSAICPECRTGVKQYQTAMDVFGSGLLLPSLPKDPTPFQTKQHRVLVRYYVVLTSS